MSTREGRMDTASKITLFLSGGALLTLVAFGFAGPMIVKFEESGDSQIRNQLQTPLGISLGLGIGLIVTGIIWYTIQLKNGISRESILLYLFITVFASFLLSNLALMVSLLQVQVK